MTPKISEQVHLIGKQGSLVGIMTRAASGSSSPKPTVVILNTGVTHRVGHQRMYVSLSRALAGLGFDVLRFDFSGIGDSEPRTDGLSPLDASLADLEEVLEWLKLTRGVSRIILVGLCSGADHAILHAQNDPRILGLVLMDPQIPTTTRFYVYYLLQRATRWRSYISVLMGRSNLVKLWKSGRVHRAQSNSEMRPASLENLRFDSSLKQSYRNVIANGAQILAVFTGDTWRQTYREQMLDAFPDIAFGDQLKIEFFGDTDHVFTKQEDRARLFEIVLDWIASLNAQLEEGAPESQVRQVPPAHREPAAGSF